MTKRLLCNAAMLGWILASVAPAWAASAEEEAIEQTREAFVACQLEGLPRVDDGVSDPKSVALALTEYCDEQYVALNKAVARFNIDNSNERRMFTIDQNAKTIKVEVSLPIVLEHRSKNPG